MSATAPAPTPAVSPARALNTRQDPRRLLVRSTNWLGDAIMSTAALQRLRQALPRTHITLLIDEKLAELWPGQPYLDFVIPFRRGESVFALARRLRGRGFDVALLFPNSLRSALEVWLARIPRRIGVARNGRSFLLTQALPTSPAEVRMHKRTDAEVRQLIQSHAKPAPLPATAHQIFHYLRLAAALGASPEPVAPRLVVPDAELAALRKRFPHDAAQPLFGLNAGAAYGPAKRWPVENFIQAAARLGGQWWIVGGPNDVALAEEIASGLRRVASGWAERATVLAGKTTLRELAAALHCCHAVVSNDSGPAHLAAAVGTPVVIPFGSTSPELTGPGLPGAGPHHLLRGEAPCAPCFRRECPVDLRCLRSVSVEQVVQALAQAARP